MANLLSGKSSREDFPILDPEQLARFASRLRSVVRLTSDGDATRRFERRSAAFDVGLEELESDASLIAALDLLDGIERARRRALIDSIAPKNPQRLEDDSGDRTTRASMSSPHPPHPRGAIVCHWPGRSLSTGEANIASRGFYDSLDRPPLGLWLEAIARPTGRSAGDFEVAILAWIPEATVERARAGWTACTNGALAPLASTSEMLARQLEPILVAAVDG